MMIAGRVLVVAIVLTLIGCSRNAIESARPAGTQSQPAGGPSQSAQAPPGKALVEDCCTRCHSTDRVYKARKDKADWARTVDDMVRKGAKLDSQERESVINYLAGK